MTLEPHRRHSWMAGFTHSPSLEAACNALERRLNEGRPPLFPDAIARLPLSELERWSD